MNLRTISLLDTGHRTIAGIQPTHGKRLKMQLAALDTAVSIEDMDVPGFRLHPLKGVAASTLNRVLNEGSGVSTEMALRLSKALGRSPESWLAMQHNYDPWQARQTVDLKRVHKIEFKFA